MYDIVLLFIQSLHSLLSGTASLLLALASRSCDWTQPMPFSRKALLPPTCVLGKRLLFVKNTLTPNNVTLIATINKVMNKVASISSKFAVQI